MNPTTCARTHRPRRPRKRHPQSPHSWFALALLSVISPLSLNAATLDTCRAPIDTATIQKLFRQYVPSGSNGRAPAGAFYHVDSRGELKVDLFSTSQHTRQAVASTQKILTAWLAVKYGRLSSKIKFSSLDLEFDLEGNRAIYPSTGKKVQVGESPKLSELLNTLLTQSSNGAAQAISRGVGKTTQTFMHWVNQEVPTLLNNYDVRSYFQNPHGLTDSDAHYQFADANQKQLSTADNMARFIGKIMAQSNFRSALKFIGMPAAGDGVLLKNGSTQAAGKTIIGRLPLTNSGCSGHALAFALFGSKADNQFVLYNQLITNLYSHLYRGRQINPEVKAALDALITADN